jgi:tRNA U54 and U55 pseudouridine synthase Pus10
MNIQVITVKENADGSADCNIRFDAEGLKFMIQYTVISILTEYAKLNPIPQPDEPVKTKRVRKKNVSAV